MTTGSSISISTIIEKGQIEREFQFFTERGIAPFSTKIVKRILANPRPCVLVAPTGYGKSVAIPYAIVRSGYKVMISLPTNALCENLYNTYLEQYPNLKIGKAYERDIHIPAGAQIIVVSNGYLKNRLLGFVKNGICKTIDSSVTDVLFLDEVHLSKLDMSIIVSLWFYCSDKFGTNVRLPRLLLSSATPADTLFGRKFAYCVTIPANMFKTVYNIDDHWQKDYPINSDSRYKDMGALLKSIHDSTPISERIVIFVPGKREMDLVIKASTIEDEIDITRVMSNSSAADMEALRRETDPKRLVVLSTPSGDAGMTIVGLVHVLDSILIKNSVETPNGATELITEYISKALSKQRRGRVGRTKPGHYYPFCTPESHSRLPDNYIPEINRLPLYRTILELVSHGLEIEDMLSIYKVPKLKQYITELLSWGLLRKTKSSGELFPSSAGLFISKVEIESPRLSSILYAWYIFDYSLPLGIILISIISYITSEIFQLPVFDDSHTTRAVQDKQREEFIETYYKRFTGRTEVHTAINIWNTMNAEVGAGSSLVDINSWCKANHLNFKLIRTVLKTIQKTYNEISTPLRSLDEESLLPNVLSITVPIISLNILRRFFQYIYSDSIALREGDTSKFVAQSSGEMMDINVTSLMNNYKEGGDEIPKQIVVIGKRQKKEKTIIEQSIDIDNDEEIEDISFETMREKLRIFV